MTNPDGVLDALEAMVRCAARYQEVNGHPAYTSFQWNGTFGTSKRRPILRRAIRVLARHGRCRIVKDAGLGSDVWCVFEKGAAHD